MAIIKYKRAGIRTKAKVLGTFDTLNIGRVINHMVPATEDTQYRVEWEGPEESHRAARIQVYMTRDEAEWLHARLTAWLKVAKG